MKSTSSRPKKLQTLAQKYTQSFVLGAALLAATTGVANAEVSGTLTLTSDYDFRGISQSALDPAVQLSFDWAGESGFYAGIWGSSIDFGPALEFDPNSDLYVDQQNPNIEVDLTLGYSSTFKEDFSYDGGYVYYTYIGEGDINGANINYGEFFLGGGWKMISAKVWYSSSYGNSGDSAWYTEANVELPLPWEFGFTVHGGYSFGDYWDTPESDDSYYDWSVGLTRALGHFDLALLYVDGSDAAAYDCPGSDVIDNGQGAQFANDCKDVFSNDSKVVFSISTTFPWSEDK